MFMLVRIPFQEKSNSIASRKCYGLICGRLSSVFMTEEVEYVARPEVTDPVVQVVNHGLYQYQAQLSDYFKQVSAEMDSQPPTPDLVYSLLSILS